MTQPDLHYEQLLWQQGKQHIAGVDEVGCGCLAGPVIAVALVMPPHCTLIHGVRDSKQLSARQRNQLYSLILNQALAVGVGAGGVKEIDHINIFNSRYLAMLRALKRLPVCDHVLLDGRDNKKVDFGAHTAIIRGDEHCYSIACASIVAKVIRDRMMQALARHYPAYAWEKNKGYGTRTHVQSLAQHGVSPHHRRSYAPVKACLTHHWLDITRGVFQRG